MTTPEKLHEKHDYEIDKSTKKPVWEKLPDIDERVRQILKDGTIKIKSRADTAREAVMPKIKGLSILKEGVYTVDLEKTTNDMFVVVKNMESQLERVLTINSLLEKDLNEAKEVIAELKESKSQLEDTIASMEDAVPSKRELQLEIEQLIGERNRAQVDIREMKSQVDKMQKLVIQHQQRSGSLEEEKQDVISEIYFLESRLNTAADQINQHREEINILRGEKLANEQKMKNLESNLQEILDEKNRLMNELKRSKKAMDELHSTITDKKLQAKKSFYMGEDAKTDKKKEKK